MTLDQPPASSLSRKLRTLLNNMEVFGPLSTIRAALSRLLSPTRETGRFDRQFGTETSAYFSMKNSPLLPVELQREAANYQPSHEAVIHHILKRLPVRPEEFVFVDAGSGKGRTLMIASMYPFSKIIGVELSPVMSEIARKNVISFGERAIELQKCKDIEVLTQNILDFKIPDENIVFFLFNPFNGSIFESFVKSVHRFSIENPNRDVFIAYCLPWCEDLLQSSGYFKKIYEHHVIVNYGNWSLWEPVR